MKTSSIVSTVAALTLAVSLGGVTQAKPEPASKTKKDVVYTAADQATFKEKVPGVSMAVLWGDPEKGAHGTFTKFAPGYDAECTHIRTMCGWSLSKALISTRMMRVRSGWVRESSSGFRAGISIGAAVTRRKARSFIRKARGNSTCYLRSKAEDGSQRSEVRGRRTEVGSQKSEVGSRKSEVGCQRGDLAKAGRAMAEFWRGVRYSGDQGCVHGEVEGALYRDGGCVDRRRKHCSSGKRFSKSGQAGA